MHKTGKKTGLHINPAICKALSQHGIIFPQYVSSAHIINGPLIWNVKAGRYLGRGVPPEI
jgi:hypothetical protein